MVEKAKVFVEKYMAGDASGHDFFHTLRVLHLAETIAREESKRKPVDMELVQLIALLHDVDDRKLSPETCENLDRARAFLNQNEVSEERIRLIVDGIKQISFKGKDSVSPDTMEARCVQDADRLDAIGAIGIARTFAFGGSRGSLMYHPGQPPRLNMDAEVYANTRSHTINHFYEKLLLLKDLMNTETGKGMALHRHAYMESFLEEFYAEWEGKL
jgi:uncharacterized protein